MLVRDVKANIGSRMMVRNVGAFKIADAITADAHRMELAMLINFSWFFVMTDSDIGRCATAE